MLSHFLLFFLFCAWRRTLLYYLPWWVFTISPLNWFCLGVGVFPSHILVCQLPSYHHLPILAVPHPITRQKVLFCLLAHCDIPLWIRVDILSHYLSWHTPSDSNSSFPLLGGMSSQQDISPKIVWASLTSDPWPTTPILAGYKLVVSEPYTCSTSMCVHGLSAAHAFVITWRLVCTFCCSFLTSCGVNGYLSLRSLCLTSFLG